MGEVKGWCPGALRPMMTGDGLLVRLRLPAGRMSFAQARAIAALSQRYGNGKISLSARTNLQLRGVNPEDHPQLITELQALGLAGDNEQAEAVRNLIVSPFDGPLNLLPLATALDARLAQDETLWALPGKFGFALDANGPGLGPTAADVTFRAAQDGRFTLHLAGSKAAFGPYTAEELPDTAARIAGVFIAARAQSPELRRMTDFTRAAQFAPLMTRLGFARRACGAPALAPAQVHLADVLGKQENFIGLAAPFGMMDAANLDALADLAEQAGAKELRLTPWRAVLIIHPRQTSGLLASDKMQNWIAAAEDPRLFVTACPGAPLCSSGESEALADAKKLAPLLAGANRLMLHVSGCAKGCAHPGAAPLTLVGKSGLYDVILHGDSHAAPARTALSPQHLPDIIAEFMRTSSVDA